MSPPRQFRALAAIGVVMTTFAGGASMSAADAGWPAPGRTATPGTSERMLEHPITVAAEPCPPPFDATTACGVATVPADWAKPDGRTLQIWFAAVPAPRGPSTGVTVPFMGGPGESISEAAERFLALVPALPDRDMLLVDVRGNGRSGRLGCPALDTASWLPAGDEQVAAIGRCGREVGAGRDDYTTVASVLDVEAIRRALRLPEPSLLGVSYGTLVVQTYAVLFPDVVQAAAIDGVVPFELDPWARTYTDALPRVLGLRCERTGLCDADQTDSAIRAVAAGLAAQPVPFPNSGRLLTEGAFSHMSTFAIQYAFADYLTAIDAALVAGDYAPLLALTDAFTVLLPPNAISGGRALAAVVACHDYSAPFNLNHNIAKRNRELAAGLAELPDDAFGWFSKQGWVDSAVEEVDFCLEYPRPRFSSQLRLPYGGPFADVPVLMLNGDIDLQTPLESAQRATHDWPNSVFVTIEDATHVTLQTSECALVTILSFLQEPILPDPTVCDSSLS